MGFRLCDWLGVINSTQSLFIQYVNLDLTNTAGYIIVN